MFDAKFLGQVPIQPQSGFMAAPPWSVQFAGQQAASAPAVEGAGENCYDCSGQVMRMTPSGRADYEAKTGRKCVVIAATDWRCQGAAKWPPTAGNGTTVRGF